MTQQQIAETNEFKGLTELQLAEKIIELSQDKKRVAGALKRTKEELSTRIINQGKTEMTLDDGRTICISPKMLTEYNVTTLKSLENCMDIQKVFQVVRQVPSGKQLQALSDIGGASAKAVIASAKHKVETDTKILKIKQPRKPRKRNR
jgi:hypothetical protein